MEITTKIKPKDRPHYINNKFFSESVVEYVKEVRAAEKAKKDLPIVTDYLAECFLKIATGLSHKSNFARYTYREEMVMDGVENSLKAILNYNIEYATRTGKPNAFAYFTQIIYFAFLRRIAKEKKQQDIKMRYISEGSIYDFADVTNASSESISVSNRFVDVLKDRINLVKTSDQHFSEYVKSKKRKKRSTAQADSDLSKIME